MPGGGDQQVLVTPERHGHQRVLDLGPAHHRQVQDLGTGHRHLRQEHHREGRGVKDVEAAAQLNRRQIEQPGHSNGEQGAEQEVSRAEVLPQGAPDDYQPHQEREFLTQ
jgi:hypothetical protein